MGALETPSGAILSDQRSLGDVSARFWIETWSQDALYVGFLVEFRASEPRFLQYLIVFLRVFRFCENSLARGFPSAFGTPKVLQERSKILARGSQEGPKDAKEAPKRLARGPKEVAKWPQEAPKGPQKVSKPPRSPTEPRQRASLSLCNHLAFFATTDF